MDGKKAARFALLTALALALSWLESLIPLPAALPGVKLGLANLAVVFALYRMGAGEAALVSLLRVTLVSMSFGNAYSFAYSLAGAALSLGVMALMKRTGRFTLRGVSIAGGVSHNVGQILVAAVVLGGGWIAYYLPALVAAGAVTGLCVGAAGAVLVERVRL